MTKLWLVVFLFAAVSCSLEKFERPVAENDKEQSADMDNETGDIENPDEEIPDYGISEIEGVVCTGQIKCYDNSDEMTCPFPGSDFYGTDAFYAMSGDCLKRDFTIS
ncbi:MAG TPA: hypothetical protein VLJ60_02360, partial [bacterium]|nr:hypothetical protein [bacterium]